MNTLPSEIIHNILRNLPQKDLINCTTVCKSFKEIIKFYRLINELVISSSNNAKIPSFNRKYKKIIIKDNEDQNALHALKLVGEDIVEIKFDQYETNLSSIVKILNYLPNVQKMTFYYISIENEDEVIGDLMQAVPQTVVLNFHESNPSIFKVLMNLKLSKLEMQFYGDTPYFDFSDFLPLMKKQKELTSFVLSGIYESNLMYGNIIPKGEYRLKEFKIRGCDFEEWIYLETYLNDHTESLEKLTIESVPGWDPSHTIKSCSNLKSLNLCEVALNELEDEMARVIELSIEDHGLYLDKFPNVEKLFMKNASSETNRLVNGKHIKKLTVRFGTVEELNCENLKNLKLINIDGPLTEDFFKTHSKVEDLRLENIFLLDDQLLEIIVSNMPHLKVLTIYGLNKLSSNAFEILKKYCKNLQVLDTKIWTQAFNINDWKCLFESNNGIEIYVEVFNF